MLKIKLNIIKQSLQKFKISKFYPKFYI